MAAPNQSKVTDKLIQALSALEKTVKTLTDSFPKGGGKAASDGSTAGGGALSALTGALGGATVALGAFTAAATLTAGALNPGAIDTLNTAFRDLLATVGVAFEPAINLMSQGLQQIANAILPLFLALRPVITQLTEIFIRALVPAIRLAATIFTALTPLLTPVIALLDGFAEILLYASAIFQTLVETITEAIAAMLGSSLSDASKEATKALQYLAQQLILFVATIAAKIGALGFVGKLIDNFQKAIHPALGGAKAGGPVTTTNLDAIVKKMSESAAKAGGFAGPSKEEEAAEREQERMRVAEETLEALKEIQKKGESDTLLSDVLAAAVACADFLKALNDVGKAVVKWLGPVFEVETGSVKDAQNAATQSFESASKGGGRPTIGASETPTLLGELGADFGTEMGRLRRKIFGG